MKSVALMLLLLPLVCFMLTASTPSSSGFLPFTTPATGTSESGCEDILLALSPEETECVIEMLVNDIAIRTCFVNLGVSY